MTLQHLAGPVLVHPIHHAFREEHLAHVVEEMLRRGPPVATAEEA